MLLKKILSIKNIDMSYKNNIKWQLAFILIVFTTLFGQFEDPVSVSATVSGSSRSGEVSQVEVIAVIEPDWHIYAINDVLPGPVPTKIFINGNIVDEQGFIDEPDPIVKYDEGFQQETAYHDKIVTFIVPFRLKKDLAVGKHEITVDVTYQACNAALCYPPKTVQLDLTVEILSGEPRNSHIGMVAASQTEIQQHMNLESAIDKGFFSFILLSLTMGFLALLTPCVFPMIPITVSFFTHRGEQEGASPVKQAIIYALGIVGTFSILGFLLAIFVGASGANQLAANPWVNLFKGSLFIYFALSLFGMYEIEIPEKFRSFSVKQESRSGNWGILFMALTFTITSFTCTVQFLGLLLVAASQGQWFWPAIGMITFSLAFATPFFFLALFPQYLAKLPKSGGWLNSVKVIMGFLEFAAAFKFLSNTDLVWEWGIFTHSAVLTLWTVISLTAGIYLLGKIQLPHDSPVKSIGVPRLLMSILFLTFGLYLATGLFGQRIHGLIYSYLPPRLEADSRLVLTNGNNSEYNLHWYTELEDGLIEAKRTGKPLFVDFTGYTCTNCRWMEANIFVEKEVKDRFKEFVLVQLYTDGGNNYREKQQYEIERFNTAALPFYVILSPEDEVIAQYPGMTRNLKEYIAFLDKGLSK